LIFKKRPSFFFITLLEKNYSKTEKFVEKIHLIFRGVKPAKNSLCEYLEILLNIGFMGFVGLGAMDSAVIVV